MNIILFGPMGAGKTTIAKILRDDFDYRIGSLGGKIHVECALHGEETREQMQKYGQAMREIFGIDVWNKYLFNILYNDPLRCMENVKVVIDDGRQLNEFDYWESKGFLCVGVYAKEVLRLERLEKRNSKLTPRESLNHDTEIQALKCFHKCDDHIQNNGSLEKLKHDVHHLVNIWRRR